MKRWGYAVLLALAATFAGNAAGSFDQKLAPENQAVHVLNRLAFGSRPGDIAEVLRMGVDKWIDLQLHPERITENPVLANKLKLLTTLDMKTWQIQEQYAPPQQLVMRPNVFPPEALEPAQWVKLQSGTVDERMAVIATLDPLKRRQLMLAAPPQLLNMLPMEIQAEATKERQAQQEERQKELRRLMPPLNELLTPDQMRVIRTGTLDQKVALLNGFDSQKRQQVLRATGPQAFIGLPELRREAMAAAQPQLLVNGDLIENKLYRAIYSNRQLEEVLADFWFNHFNVFNGKGPGRVLLTSYERDAIRPHVLGRFHDLLLATARHPAMLFYLDNVQSQAPRDDVQPPFGANAAQLRRPGLNENYGRELMELHTLGVDGGYTQDDVIAVARAFTGWTIYDQAKYAEFQFNPGAHDRKEKVVLGHTLPAGRGLEDGEDVIRILASHPSTARFISKKLAQRFVADDPPQTLVNRMAETFTKSDGDIRAVLQTMFSSTEFLSEGAWQAKMKSPLEMVVSAVRAVDADTADAFVLAQRIADLGQPLYGKVEPTGYPNTGEMWGTDGGVLGRINLALALAAGQVPGVRADMSRFNFKAPPVVATELLSMPPSPAMLNAMDRGIQGKEATPSMIVGLVLGSPEFQKR